MKPCTIILPSSLMSAFAADTKASDLDSTAVSQIFAASLTARGKHSPSQTWLRKWKTDCWTRLLFSQMSQLSLGNNTLHTWLEGFSLSGGLANQSPALESEKPQRTSDGCSTSSQMELPLCAPDSSSQKMSKDCSLPKCPTDHWSSPIASRDWKAYITKLRQEYSARVKSVRLTSGSGSSSWPSPIASEVRQGFQDRSRGMKGSQESLTTVVIKEANWATPDTCSRGDGPSQLDRNTPTLQTQARTWATPSTREWKGHTITEQHPDGFNLTLSNQVIEQYGPAAQANRNTDGSHLESWRTPSSSDGEGGVMEMREGCAGKYKLRDHVVAVQKQEWRTPTVAEEKNQNTSTQIYLQNQVGATPKQWATPRSGKTTDENPETWALRQAKGDVATMPLTAQVKNHTNGKLNPRWVETLMGLPVGWTMPSCAYPVTIELTSCASLATESCQQQQPELL